MMDIQMLTPFFKWCTIINGTLLALWIISYLLAPEWVYRTQSRWFSIPRETFKVVFYSFLGGFKIIFLVFNLVPYIVLVVLR